MLTRPIGPINPNQAQALLAKRERRARIPEEIAALAELVPRDLLERLARATRAARFAALDAEDSIVVQGSPEQATADFEREKAGSDWDRLPPELRTQMEDLASWTASAAGKRRSELMAEIDPAELTRIQEREIQDVLENAPRLLATAWLELPYLLRVNGASPTPEMYRLNERLLPVDPPSEDTFLPAQGFPDWETPMAHPLMAWLDVDAVRQLYDAFAANVRAKLDAAPDAPFDFAGELLFGKDADGYHVTFL